MSSTSFSNDNQVRRYNKKIEQKRSCCWLLDQSNVVLGNGPLKIKPLRIKDMSEANHRQPLCGFFPGLCCRLRSSFRKIFLLKYRMLTQKTRRGFFFWFELCPMPILIFLPHNCFSFFRLPDIGKNLKFKIRSGNVSNKK
jgi:hypothetical protein